MKFLVAPFFVMFCFLASLLADEPKAMPTPAEDMKAMQGSWKIKSLYWSSQKNEQLPNEAKLNELETALAIEGNKILHDGKVVATLTNDLPPGPQHQEVGWQGFNRLLLLTMPDGKGIWCSYSFREGRLQITYPHTTSCHRGSGQIIYLARQSE